MLAIHLEWAQSVKLVIDGRGKLGYLTGEESRPEATDSSFRRWRSENSLIIAVVVKFNGGPISEIVYVHWRPEIFRRVSGKLTLISENSSQIFELKNQLWLSRQGGCTLTMYLNEMLNYGMD